jgi:hypothetical protein
MLELGFTSQYCLACRCVTDHRVLTENTKTLLVKRCMKCESRKTMLELRDEI